MKIKLNHKPIKGTLSKKDSMKIEECLLYSKGESAYDPLSGDIVHVKRISSRILNGKDNLSKYVVSVNTKKGNSEIVKLATSRKNTLSTGEKAFDGSDREQRVGKNVYVTMVNNATDKKIKNKYLKNTKYEVGKKTQKVIKKVCKKKHNLIVLSSQNGT